MLIQAIFILSSPVFQQKSKVLLKSCTCSKRVCSPCANDEMTIADVMLGVFSVEMNSLSFSLHPKTWHISEYTNVSVFLPIYITANIIYANEYYIHNFCIKQIISYYLLKHKPYSMTGTYIYSIQMLPSLLVY